MTNEAEITFLYNGSSNSTLVKMPGGSSVMINAGTSNEKYNSAERTVIPYLRASSLNKIDLLILNSMDKNEYRNLLFLVSNFEVTKIMLPVYYKSVMENKSFIKNFGNTKIDYITSSRIVNQKGNFRLYIYYDSLYKGSTMMTQFLFGDQSFVFNDAVKPEDIIFNAVYINTLDLNMQVLRVPGSGSFLSTPAQFICETDHEYIVIGETNSGRRKVNAEIFSIALIEFGYNILNVGKEGAVILKTNGDFTSRVVWR
jgi:beta-lactamase superfamily II metal-dependent hydrolase